MARIRARKSSGLDPDLRSDQRPAKSDAAAAAVVPSTQNGTGDLVFDSDEQASEAGSDAGSSGTDDEARDHDMSVFPTGDFGSDAPPDDVEEELQRLVFGDDAGFRRGIRASATSIEVQRPENSSETAKAGTAGLGDNFFVMDTGGNELMVLDGDQTGEIDEEEATTGAAWEDSDDDRLTVSLASVAMLRKLRKTEAEDMVSGREYIKRLRRRYEILHPRPDWAVEAMQRPTKRRKTEGESSADEMDISDDDGVVASTAPLSQLLRSSSSLIRRSDSTPSGKRKLRPEVIDIQRTRDIDLVQPSAITSLAFHPSYPFLLSSGPSSTLYLHYICPSPPAQTPNPLLTSLHVRGTALTTTAFHPLDSRIFLSARRRYFHIWNLDTGRVEKIARVYGHAHEQRTMERFRLSPDGKLMALVASSRKGGGAINLLDAQTLQWTSQVRVDGRGGIADFAWWSDGRGLSIVAKTGEVTEFSVTAGRVVARWNDQGAVGITTLALGGGGRRPSPPSAAAAKGHPGAEIGPDRWVAIGSSSGVVNIYDRRAWLDDAATEQRQKQTQKQTQTQTRETSDGSREGGADPQRSVVPADPTPVRALDNLTTPISNLSFAADGQVLAVSSRWKKDALRLVHLPSATVYKNWPTGKTPLGRVTATAFGTVPAAAAADGVGRGSAVEVEVLAVANEAGRIRLWEIRA